MKKNIDKLFKLITIKLNNFFIHLSIKIFLPQKIHADKKYYMDKFEELKSSTKKSDLKIEYKIPDTFIFPLALKTVVVKKSNLSIDMVSSYIPS